MLIAKGSMNHFVIEYGVCIFHYFWDVDPFDIWGDYVVDPFAIILSHHVYDHFADAIVGP